MSALGWYICFPLSASTKVYAALLEFCGIFLNHTASVQSAVAFDKFPETGVHKAGVTNVGEVSVLFVKVCDVVKSAVIAVLILNVLADLDNPLPAITCPAPEN